MSRWTRANPLMSVSGYKVPRGHYANGYTNGGDRVGFRNGGPVDRHPPSEKEKRAQRQADYMKKHGPQKPLRKTLGVTDKYKEVREKRKFSEAGFKPLRTSKQLGGRIGLKKGSNKNWIQKAVNPKHKGFCTPMTKKTCTPKRKALAKTFKKMGRARKGKG